MRSFSVPGGAKGRRAVVYRKFRGVDFSADPALIDRSRSPYAPNLISDSGGFPEKTPRMAHIADFFRTDQRDFSRGDGRGNPSSCACGG